MRIVTYLGFTLLSILIQFSVMDFIQSIMQLEEKLIDTPNATSQKRHLRDVLKDLNYKPHALFYRTQMNKLGKDNVSAKTYDNTSLPDLLVTTTETGAKVFEILYDDSTFSTEEETYFTTEAVSTSTEIENVTEITLFGNTNITTAKPNMKPQKLPNKDCKCNFLHEVCDINCCCDADCSEVELSMFLKCTKNQTTGPHRNDACYTSLFQFGHDDSITTALNDWFCIVKINLPKTSTENKKILLTSDNFFTWKGIEKPQLNYEFTNDIYKYGDPVWLIKNGSIYYIDLPLPVINSYCTGRKTIQFLKNQKYSCHVKISDLEMFQVMKSSEEASVISATPMSKNSTYLNCSSLHCINWTLIICENRVCENYNKSIHEPTCTESVCINLALKVEYIFNYHESKITNATLKFHVQKVPINLHYLTQEIDVKFVLINESIEHVIKLSGNPGYMEGLPVIVSYAENNYTNTFYNKSSKLKTYLTLPESQDGTCIASNLTENFVLFGINRRMKCRYNHKYTKLHNGTEQCQSIQSHINRLFEFNKVAVSALGDPSNSKDKDWIHMVMNVSDNQFMNGEVLEMSSKLYCYNIITRYSFVFSYAEVEGNNRILWIKLETTLRNVSFSVDDISIVVTTDVNFIDVSRPSAIQYASGPNLNFYLPNDLFFPFPSNKSRVISLNVLSLILYCCIAILAIK